MIDYGFGIYLGGVSEADPDKLLVWRNDYRIWQHCRQNDLIPKGAHLKWYEKQLDGNPVDHMYSICTKEGFVLGVCGLTGIDLENARAEFSLYIAPQFQRKGHGQAALKTLISHGFNSLPLESIWGESYSFNPARRMFQAIGFKEDGVRRHFYYRDGKFIDAYIYSLLRTEWEAAHAFQSQKVQICLP